MNYDKSLIGKTVEKIYMNEEYLTFVTDDGNVSFTVDADCCSYSYFFDFYGVANLLGKKVTAFESVDLGPGDPGYRKETFGDGDGYVPGGECIQVYGFRITTEHPLFGDVTAIFSFRNDSNGYYGGWLETAKRDLEDERYRILEDLIGG